MIKSDKTIRKVFELIGATDVEPYTLISNWGYTFKIGDEKYDMRFWENEYGFSPNEWRMHHCHDGVRTPIENALSECLYFMFNLSNLEDKE